MPYQRNTDLPAKIRRILPSGEAQSIFRNVFNDALRRKRPESVAYASAYRAVENAGFQRDREGVYRKSYVIDQEERDRLRAYVKAATAAADEFAQTVDVGVRLDAIVIKTDEERRLVFGWFSVIEEDGSQVIDSQGDVILEKDMEETVYQFNLDSRAAGVMHKRSEDGAPVVVGQLVESVFFSKEKQEVLGIDLQKIGWWGGFYVEDDKTWESIKSGKFPSFSIAGRGRRIPLEAA